jgi:hypothetical protein
MDIEKTGELPEGEREIRRSLGRVPDNEIFGEEELVRLVQEHEGKEPKVYAICRGRDPETYESRYFMAIGKDPSDEKLEKYLKLSSRLRGRLTKKNFDIKIRLLAVGQREAAYYGRIVYEMPCQAQTALPDNAPDNKIPPETLPEAQPGKA